MNAFFVEDPQVYKGGGFVLQEVEDLVEVDRSARLSRCTIRPQIRDPISSPEECLDHLPVIFDDPPHARHGLVSMDVVK